MTDEWFQVNDIVEETATPGSFHRVRMILDKVANSSKPYAVPTVTPPEVL